MDRSEWPSERKFETLREHGVIPYSYFSTKAITLVLMLVLGFLVGQDWGVEFAGSIKTLFAKTEDLDGLFGALRAVMIQSMRVLILISGAVVILTFVIGLIQTRFLFRTANLNFSLQRLVSLRNLNPYRYLLGLFWALTGGMLALLAGTLLALFYSSQVLSILNNGRAYLIGLPNQALSKGLPIVVPVVLLAAVVSWLFSRYWFMFSHRMTPKEKEQELD